MFLVALLVLVANLTPEQRSLRGRIAALRRWAHEDPVEGTKAARQAFLDRFDREADPDGKLTAEERAKRAARLRKAHMAELALRSAKARSAKAGRDAA